MKKKIWCHDTLRWKTRSSAEQWYPYGAEDIERWTFLVVSKLLFSFLVLLFIILLPPHWFSFFIVLLFNIFDMTKHFRSLTYAIQVWHVVSIVVQCWYSGYNTYAGSNICFSRVALFDVLSFANVCPWHVQVNPWKGKFWELTSSTCITNRSNRSRPIQ